MMMPSHNNNQQQSPPQTEEEEDDYDYDVLSEEQIETFVRDGVLVVDNLLNECEIQAALCGLSKTLESHGGILTTDLVHTGHRLVELSSTNGSGGVLDIFYEDWKMGSLIATNPKLFRATSQLWQGAFCHDGEEEPTPTPSSSSLSSDLDVDNKNNGDHEHDTKKKNLLYHRWHPYGSFDYRKGYCYIDRIGYRLPTELAERLGSELLHQQQQQQQSGEGQQQQQSTNTNSDNKNNQKKKKKKKSMAIQRSLTPHLDCCPSEFSSSSSSSAKNKTKWRPIQCFVSLSDTQQANHGGFEAAKGFHKDFHLWAKNRLPTTLIRKKNNKKKQQPRKGKAPPPAAEEEATTTTTTTTTTTNNTITTTSIPAPCIGEYTHIRPIEDKDVMERIEHIPVKAGSAVFFDNRIPHSNSYRHDGIEPRCVVYCSFLPDVPINRRYANQQLLNFKRNINPNDQWINGSTTTAEGQEKDMEQQQEEVDISTIPWLSTSPLARKLMNIDPW